MTHPNAQVLEKLYRDFAAGNLPAVLTACADSITFEVKGKSRLAGKYTKETFGNFVTKLRELSGGTFQVDVHDILASDRHGVVLASDLLQRNGEKVQIRTVHVWRFEEGKPVAWYEYPRDMYQYDQVWS